MKKIDRDGLILCKLQGDVFSSSITSVESSSEIFIRRFMNSKIAKEFDSLAILDDSTTKADVFDSIEKQFGKTNYGKTKYNSEVLFWIGYLYRYTAYTYGLSSKQIYKIIKPKELNTLYYPYHSLDCAQAIERIFEQKNISFDIEQQNKRLLKLLKKQRYEDGIEIKEIKNNTKQILFDVLYHNISIGTINLIQYNETYKKIEITFDNTQYKNDIFESTLLRKFTEYSKEKNTIKNFVIEIPKENDDYDFIEDSGFNYLKEDNKSIYYAKSI